MCSGKPGEPGDSEVQEEEMPRVLNMTQGFPEPEWDLTNDIPGME